MIDISFIILTWNSKKYIECCFDSIISKCQSEQIRFEIIVIDNASNDNSIDVFGRYKTDFPENFVFILLSENTGTTYSRNQGLKRAKGKYICILDSDTELAVGRLGQVVYFLTRDKGIGIIAPRLEYPDGTVQNSVKKFPSFLDKVSKLPKALLKIPVPNRDFYGGFPFTTPQPVDSAISACWFFHRRLLDTVGLLDERIFYSPEDLDYCLRVGKAGYRIVYLPEFTVIHHTQQISHKKPLSRLSLSHFGGLLYYFRKHGGWFSTRALQYRMVQAQAGGRSRDIGLAENL